MHTIHRSPSNLIQTAAERLSCHSANLSTTAITRSYVACWRVTTERKARGAADADNFDSQCASLDHTGRQGHKLVRVRWADDHFNVESHYRTRRSCIKFRANS